MRFLWLLSIFSVVGWSLPLKALAMDQVESSSSSQEIATFAGGCFWCMQPPFDRVPGVVRTRVGYAGGTVKDPSYEEVSAGRTGHLEAIEVVYDPQQVSYAALLEVFWQNIDPTDARGQFADQGSQYRTAIFYHSEQQRQTAEASKQALQASGKFKQPIATQVLPAAPFYVAEDYHQNYYQKQPGHYQRYSIGSGRKGFLQRVWGKQE